MAAKQRQVRSNVKLGRNRHARRAFHHALTHTNGSRCGSTCSISSRPQGTEYPSRNFATPQAQELLAVNPRAASDSPYGEIANTRCARRSRASSTAPPSACNSQAARRPRSRGLGVGCFKTGRRRRAIVRDRKRSDDRLDRACRTERVARRALHRPHGDLKARSSSPHSARSALDSVASLACVHVPCALKCPRSATVKPPSSSACALRGQRLCPRGSGARHVVGIARRTETGDFR